MFTRAFRYKRFVLNDLPKWTCPRCGCSLIVHSNFTEHEIAEFRAIPEVFMDETGEPIFIDKDQLRETKRRFTGFLNCTSKSCSEIVTISGEVFTGQFESDRTNDDASEEVLADFYVPHFISPGVPIIKLHSQYSKALMDELRLSFTLYWLDNAACLNRIRTTVEILLDHLNVVKRTKKDGKYKDLSLHKRIEKYSEKDKVCGDFLLAIKWVGNAGSHNDSVSNQDVLNAYLLLDKVLNILFVKHDAHLVSLSRSINRRKRP